jgi:hypothetical protein
MTNRANQEWPADTVTELDVTETAMWILLRAITHLQNGRERGVFPLTGPRETAIQLLYNALDTL